MLINITKINLNPNVGGGKPIELESKEITITENGTTTVVPSEGFGGLSSVDIDVYIANPAEEIDFSEIGYDATDNQNANMVIQDSIEYAKKIQAEYTDSKIYNGDNKIIFFPFVDFSNRTSCGGLFNGCGGLQYVPPLTITNKCTNMNSSFEKCGALDFLDVSNFNTSNVTNMSSLFNGCKLLTKIIGIENWDTSNVNNISYMFNECKTLEILNLSNWNISSKVTSINTTFQLCEALTKIIGIENWDTSNVTSMSTLFNGCKTLENLNLSNWNVSKVTNLYAIFQGCSLLTNLQAPQNINANIDFKACNLLTVDSLLSILNNLTDRTSTTSLTCTLGSTNLNKLTAEQKAIATSKNWVLQ